MSGSWPPAAVTAATFILTASGVSIVIRAVFALAAVCLLVGCGASASSAPTATPGRPTSTPIAQWSRSPDITVDPNAHYTATVETTDGSFTIQLLPKVAPIAVNNFIFLARHHFFDHNVIERIVPDQIIQTGDPTGTRSGGPGYRFKDERVTLPYTSGSVAMANSGSNTNGSQFFIVITPPGTAIPYNPPAYTIFGRVASGMSVVYKIGKTPVGPNAINGDQDQPLDLVYLTRVTIQQSR